MMIISKIIYYLIRMCYQIIVNVFCLSNNSYYWLTLALVRHYIYARLRASILFDNGEWYHQLINSIMARQREKNNINFAVYKFNRLDRILEFNLRFDSRGAWMFWKYNFLYRCLSESNHFKCMRLGSIFDRPGDIG